MSNNQLPTSLQERIKADAEAAADNHADELRKGKMEYAAMIMRLFGYKEGYITGATAVHERVQVLVDKLRDIASGKVLPHLIAINALQQWKGKEVEKSADLQVQSIPYTGYCFECDSRPATTDYNGHGHYVCQQCNDSLNRAFDEYE